MLLVDNRIGSKELHPALAKQVESQLTHMEFADFSWLGKGPDDSLACVGVERKRIGDLISSMQSGRLSGHQLRGLINNHDITYLLVEGMWKSDKDGLLCTYKYGKWVPYSHGRGVMVREVSNYLNTLAIACGVKVWQTQTAEMSVGWLVNTYRWWQKRWEQHGAWKQFHVSPMTQVKLRKPTLVERVAKEFDGVGWERAMGVGKRFGSVMEMVVADQKGWLGIDGIGKGLAGKIQGQIFKNEK